MKSAVSPKQPAAKNPFRKISFDMQRDVALMLHEFGRDNPASKLSWHINAALRGYLTQQGYAKRLTKLEKLFPETAILKPRD